GHGPAIAATARADAPRAGADRSRSRTVRYPGAVLSRAPGAHPRAYPPAGRADRASIGRGPGPNRIGALTRKRSGSSLPQREGEGIIDNAFLSARGDLVAT